MASTKKNESVKSAKRSNNASEKKKDDEARTNTEDIGRTQRNKERLRYQVGEGANFHSKGQKQKKVKPSTHEKAFQMYSLHSTNTFMKTKKVRSTKKRRKQSRATKTMEECLINSTPSQYLQKTRSKMLSTASRKVKQKTALEYELNRSKIALTR